MKNVNEMNLDEIKALETEIKARKSVLKETVKAEKATSEAEIVDTVNEMIDNKVLQNNMNIVVKYMDTEVTGKIVGVLSVEKDSITVESTEFKTTKDDDGSPKRRYIKKSKFVRIAG